MLKKELKEENIRLRKEIADLRKTIQSERGKCDNRESALLAKISLYEDTVKYAVTSFPKFLERLQQAYHTPIEGSGKACRERKVANRRIDSMGVTETFLGATLY